MQTNSCVHTFSLPTQGSAEGARRQTRKKRSSSVKPGSKQNEEDKPKVKETEPKAKEEEPIDPVNLTSYIVMNNPKKFLEKFVDYWSSDEHRPEAVDHEPNVVADWEKQKTKKGKQKYKFARHNTLPGCCRHWWNNAVDFAISQGYLPCVFQVEEDIANLVPQFTACCWVCYVGYMDGRPAVDSDKAVKVNNLKTACVDVCPHA